MPRIAAKSCSRCGEEKPHDCFPKVGRQCRQCHANRAREWHKANPERAKAASKEYYWANREKQIEASKDWYRNNRDRARERERTWRAANPEKMGALRRRDHLKRVYGITPDEYDAMLQEQGGKCAICREPRAEGAPRLAVDHCHESGAVRGLLCRECNLAIGYLRDNPEFCQSAARYLGASK